MLSAKFFSLALDNMEVLKMKALGAEVLIKAGNLKTDTLKADVYCTYVDLFNDKILFHSNGDVINGSGIVSYDGLGLDGEPSNSGCLSSDFISAAKDDLICFVLNKRYDLDVIRDENSDLYFETYHNVVKNEEPDLIFELSHDATVAASIYGEDFSVFLRSQPDIIRGVSFLAQEVLLYRDGTSTKERYTKYLRNDNSFCVPTINADFKDIYIEKDEKIYPATTYKFPSFADFFHFYLSVLIKNGITLKVCQNCKKYFVAERSDSKHCKYPAPQDNAKSCREYINYDTGLKKKRDDDKRIYKQITNMLNGRYKRLADGSIKDEVSKKLDGFMDEASVWRERVKEGEVLKDEYVEWLKKEHEGFLGK